MSKKSKAVNPITASKGATSTANTKIVEDTATTLASAALAAAPTPQGVSAAAPAVEASSVIASTKLPITIFIVSQNHDHSVFLEKALEEIGRLHNAGIDMSFALEEPHDKYIYGQVAHYFKANFNGDKAVELMAEKMLEFSCSSGPSVKHEQIEQFLKNSKYAETAKKHHAIINFTFNNVIKKSDQDEVPNLSVSQMYSALRYYRSFSLLRYLQNRKLSCVGLDISSRDREKFYNVSRLKKRELLESHEDIRIAEMTKRLSTIVKSMSNTGGVIWALNVGCFHLHRLGVWMLRESRRNPELQKYDIQLKLIYGRTNRKILTKSGIDIDASVLHSFEEELAEMKKKDSDEIRALYSEIPCHTLMFQKKENGTFGVACPELSDMVTQAITRHKPNSKLALKTASLPGSKGAPATASAVGSKAAMGSTTAAAPAPAKADGSSSVLMYSKKGASLGSVSSTLTMGMVEGGANGSAIQITEDMTAPPKLKILSMGRKSFD